MVTVQQGWSYPERKLGIPFSEVGDSSNIIPSLACSVMQPNVACMLPANNLDIWLKRIPAKKNYKLSKILIVWTEAKNKKTAQLKFFLFNHITKLK